ncbi:MAG TPA: CoA-binding protein [Bryobacteraceae bacterium]|nr:CoA-binding protein [Bryobacteraceae bacterium]
MVTIPKMGSIVTIPELLRKSKTIAVVGLSSNRMRPSFGVSEYLQREGYRIIPVNPQESEILGEKVYARLEDIPEHVDIVDVFRRPEFVPEIAESAIRIGANALWLQEEVVHPQAAQRAREAGLTVVMDKCILKEHRRLV